jgi:hypothetical protein
VFTGIRWYNSSNYNVGPGLAGGANANVKCRCGQAAGVGSCDALNAAFVSNALAGRNGWLRVSRGASIGVNPYIANNHAPFMIIRGKFMPWIDANGPDFSTGVGITNMTGTNAIKNVTVPDGTGAMFGIAGAAPSTNGKYTMEVSMERVANGQVYIACVDFEVVSGAGATAASASLVFVLALLAVLI